MSTLLLRMLFGVLRLFRPRGTRRGAESYWRRKDPPSGPYDAY